MYGCLCTRAQVAVPVSATTSTCTRTKMCTYRVHVCVRVFVQSCSPHARQHCSLYNALIVVIAEATSFLQRVKTFLSNQLKMLPSRYSVTALLNSWVRTSTVHPTPLSPSLQCHSRCAWLQFCAHKVQLATDGLHEVLRQNAVDC